MSDAADLVMMRLRHLLDSGQVPDISVEVQTLADLTEMVALLVTAGWRSAAAPELVQSVVTKHQWWSCYTYNHNETAAGPRTITVRTACEPLLVADQVDHPDIEAIKGGEL